MQLHLVYFSPTHTSRTIGRSIALGCNTDNITETDLTYRHPGQPIVIQADIAIVAVPVYGGRVAETAMERLQWIKGQQTPVIPLVVYGNRDYEDALLELTDHLKNARVLSAGSSSLYRRTFLQPDGYADCRRTTGCCRPNRSNNIRVQSR